MQDLAGLLEKISKVKGTERKKQLFKTFLEQWREAHKKLHPTDADTTVCGTPFVGLTLHACAMYPIACV